MSAGNFWMQNSAVWLTLTSLPLFLFIKHRTSIWIALLTTYIFIYQIWFGLNANESVFRISSNGNIALQSLVFWAIPVLISFNSYALNFLKASGFIVSLLLIFGYRSLLNTTNDALFVACIIPLLGSRFALLNSIGVLMSAGSTALAGLMIGLINRVSWRLYVIGIGIISTISYFFFLLSGRSLNDKGRFHYAWLCLKQWWQEGNFLFGWGPGMAPFKGAGIQLKSDFMQWGMFVWTHNDWIQILLEYGFIGLLLTLLAVVSLMNKARHKKSAFSSLLVFFFGMLFQMPLRHPLSVLLLVVLVQICFQKRSQAYPSYT